MTRLRCSNRASGALHQKTDLAPSWKRSLFKSRNSRVFYRTLVADSQRQGGKDQGKEERLE